MAKVSWTTQALEDLRGICDYIGRDAPAVASVFVARIYSSTGRLGAFPQSGRMVPEFNRQDLREIIVGSYRVLYRIQQSEVEVLTIHHGARQLDSFDPPPALPGDDR